MKSTKALLNTIVAIVFIAIVVFLVIYQIKVSSTNTGEENNISTDVVKVGKASISIEPSNITVKKGDTFRVKVILDTKGESVYGVDLSALRFSPDVLKVIDSDTKVNGVQIFAGDILDMVALNSADNTKGEIKFSKLATPGTSYSGTGVLAEISFEAIKDGSSNLDLDFTPGSTTDSNVAGSNYDALGVVNGAKVQVISAK